MTTAITTAARRIARVINAGTPADRGYFAADGSVLYRLVGPEPFGPTAKDLYGAGSLRRGWRWSHREAQDMLDERAGCSSTATYLAGA